MEIIETEVDRFRKAKKKVDEIRGFYISLIVYILVIAFLAFINLTTTPHYLWFLWPLLGWGIGILFHAMKVFNYLPFLGKDWENKKMKEFLEQEKQNTTKWK